MSLSYMMKPMYAKIAVALTLAMLSGIVHAQSQVSESCHILYRNFTQADTLEDAGIIAYRMMEDNCWPSLQGVITEQPDLSNVTDCTSLQPHIKDLWNNTHGQTTTILAFHNLSHITEDQLFQIMLRTPADSPSATLLMKIENPPNGVSRQLNCFGPIRFSNGLCESQIYLDKDNATGELYYGIQPLC